MSATCPSGGSYTFRSILHGRDLLREGVIWHIGDGSTVNIHHDPWIPRQGSLLPLGAVFIPGIQKVADLLNLTGETWDHTKLQAMFSVDDANDIKQIVVGGPGVPEYIAWNHTKKGCLHCQVSLPPENGHECCKTGPARTLFGCSYPPWLAVIVGYIGPGESKNPHVAVGQERVGCWR